MKKAYILLLLIYFSNTAFSQNSDYTVITENWAPYNYEENGRVVGLTTEIVNRILSTLHENKKITILPIARASLALNTKHHIIMFSMFKTDERLNKYKWVGPIVEDSIYFYKRKNDTSTYTKFDDFKKAKTIACRHKGLIVNLLTSKGFQNLDTTATDGYQIYRKLLLNRSDLAISDTEIGVRYIMKSIGHDISEIEKIPITIFKSNLYIAFSKDSDDKYIKQWQNIFDDLKKSGEIDRIIRKYK